MRLKLKKVLAVFLAIVSCLIASTDAHAESDFNFTLYGGSSNFWSNTLFQIPINGLSNLTNYLVNGEGSLGGAYRLDLLSIKEGGNKVSIYQGKFFGFKAKDLFSDIQYGLKLGWAPKFSPFGVYVSCAYQFRRFEGDFSQIGHNVYKLNSIRPGIGIRVTPFISLVEDDKWSPIVEIGTSYNYYFNTKGPFDNAKDQFNSGMISTFAVGARSKYVSITGGVEIHQYSIFNKKFSPDNGITLPYADVKTNLLTIFVSFIREF